MSRWPFLFAILCAASAAQAQEYVFEDVPLPPGFVETAGGFSFAADQGRIHEARAEGRADAALVRDFYLETLPQLGWSFSPRADESLVFLRGREVLSFTLREEDGAVDLGVRLVTHAPPRD